MISGWEKREAYRTNTSSPDSVRALKYGEYSEIRRHGLSGLSGLKKNEMWLLRQVTSKLLRQESAADTRPVLRRRPYIPGSGSPQGTVQAVRQSEAGETPLAGKQPLLYQEVFLLCRKEVPGNDDQGRGERTETGLAQRKDPGEGLHAGAAEAQPCGSAPCYWDRRNLLKEGAYLSDRGKRP